MFGWIDRPGLITASFLLLILSRNPAAAEEKESRPGVVLEITRSFKTEESRSFRRIISDSVRWELERSGLLVISEPDLSGDSSIESLYKGDKIDENSLLKLARQVKADFVIIGEFTTRNREILLDFSWYDVEEERFSASSSKLEKVDLMLDRVISEAVSEILYAVRKRLANFSRSEFKRPSEAEGTAPASVSKESEQQDISRQDEIKAVKGETIDTRPEMQIPRGKHFELSTGFAPFLVTGAASKYFKIGYLASLYGNFRIDLGTGQLGIGWFFGINIFGAEGVVAATDNLLIPLGLDFRYIIGNGLPLGLFVHISGGPAIFIVDSTLKGGLVNVMPYVMGGIGLSLPFSDFFGIAVDTSYAVFFEQSILIMGFTPSGYIYLSF